MWANDVSGFWEWNGPPEKPPPDGSRTTIGTGVRARKYCFAATVTRWSHAADDDPAGGELSAHVGIVAVSDRSGI